jgi:hypothetical protein
VFVAFYGCDKIAEKNNLKEKRFILAHSFKVHIPWPHCSELWWGKNIMVRNMWWSKQEGGNRAGDKMSPSRACPQCSTASNWVPPRQTPPPPNSPFNYELINELIHRWDQRPHDSFTSKKPHLWTVLLETKPSTQDRSSMQKAMSKPNMDT